MPDHGGTPAITLAAIDPYAIPGWSSSDIVSPDRRTPALLEPGERPEERPPLDYDVRLVAYMDCVEYGQDHATVRFVSWTSRLIL